MSQPQQAQAMNMAAAMGTLSSRVAQQTNAARLQAADMNIRAGQNQIELDLQQRRTKVARAAASYTGSLAADAAFRGSGGTATGSNAAIATAARLQAGEDSAFAVANAAAAETALIASNQVILEDPVMAGIQGAMQGMQIGAQLQQALAAASFVREQVVRRSGSHQQIFTEIVTPGFNPAQIFQQFILPGGS